MRRARWMVVCAALAVGCGSDVTVEEAETERSDEGGETNVVVVRDEEPAPQEPTDEGDESNSRRAIAELAPTEGNAASGTVVFTQAGDSVHVTVNLSGLTANGRHGFHVHETGDCSAPDGSSAGGHFNPEGHDHALPPSAERHAGDMGNVEADEEGRVSMELDLTNITLEDANAIMGRAVIVHAAPDDGGQPTGNAGARLACGVIEPEGGAE